MALLRIYLNLGGARFGPTANPLDLLPQPQLRDAEGISNCRIFGICRSLSRHRNRGTHTECRVGIHGRSALPSMETIKYLMTPQEFMRGSLALELRPDGATRYGETTLRQP